MPEQIRGYGPVKSRHLAHAKKREAELLEAFRRDDEPTQERGEGLEHPVVVMAG